MLPPRPFFKFEPKDDAVWKVLYERQLPHIMELGSQDYWIAGFDGLGMTADRIPDMEKLSARLHELSGWVLYSTDTIFADGQDWFEHLQRKEFLMSEYIREMKDIDYTPLPDVFHDAFGHLPSMAIPRYVEMVSTFTEAILACDPAKRRGLGSIWWHTVEFGLIKENGKMKAFGAGLASSYGELRHAFTPGNVDIRPFVPEDIMQFRPSPHSYHERLWLMDNFEQLEEFLYDWIKNGKGAPVAESV